MVSGGLRWSLRKLLLDSGGLSGRLVWSHARAHGAVTSCNVVCCYVARHPLAPSRYERLAMRVDFV